MKHFLKKTPVFMVLLLALAVLLYWLGGVLSHWTGVGKFIQNVFFCIALIAVLWFLLTKTKKGQRLKRELIDPYIKPFGEESHYWDQNGKVKTPASDRQERPSRAGGKLKRSYLIIGIAAFAVLMIIVLLLTHQRSMDSLRTTNQGIELFLNGLIHANLNEIQEGWQLLLSGIWSDLSNFLIILVLILIVFGIIFALIRIHRKRNQYHFEDNDTDDS